MHDVTRTEAHDGIAFNRLREWASENAEFRTFEIKFMYQGDYKPVSVYIRDLTVSRRAAVGTARTLTRAVADALANFDRSVARQYALAGGR